MYLLKGILRRERGSAAGPDRVDADTDISIANATAPLPTTGVAGRYATRMVITAGPPPRNRRRTVYMASFALLCVAVAGGWVYTRLSVAAVLVPERIPAPPPREAIPAAPETSPASPPRRPRGRVRDAAGAADLAQRIELVPLPEETRFEVKRRAAPPPGDRLVAAWMALLHGDPVAAIGGYEEVLASEPDNRQALLGVAAVEARRGETAQARRSYLRLLERDPADPLALAGLLDLEPAGDMQARERRLKQLIARHPDLAPLQSAMGTLYAQEERWSDAWRAYDRASAIEDRAGINDPDTAFNLAVALDHLGRRSEARARYEQALNGARERKPAFDPGAVEARVRALSEI